MSENQFEQVRSIMEDSSSDDDEGEEEVSRIKHMTRDKEEAMAHYGQIWTKQKQDLAKPGWFGGESKGKQRPSMQMEPTARRHSKMRNNTMVRRQLQALPSFTAWFIYLVTLAQV